VSRAVSLTPLAGPPERKLPKVTSRGRRWTGRPEGMTGVWLVRQLGGGMRRRGAKAGEAKGLERDPGDY
jgi:hypothetical protein